ncbi:hypothetical protein PLICRDRAFT_117320 [Plicaturopsis crispa FD-325 SS-3]|uniref:Carboxylic ester hydrolase n=1 Tax=Plicaturopsis crispa FD-325 SS-3 TaxID=944288 RepID=A0A0C9SL42_PLICR|nr:hypothetical protein PLICRDRAFT_117320 [Plicaturopsis crispa FD-325 SS-3]
MGNVLSYTTTPTILDVASHGQVEGVVLERDGEQRAKRFLNVPFVLPPTGQYRWRKPRPLPADYSYSTPDGKPRDCTRFGAICPQPQYTKLGNKDATVENPNKYDEDCLVLNIWTPPGNPPAEGWPVMLWFHGGWLQVGDPSNDPNMDPTELVSHSGGALDCVFIASAYRISVFGFLGSQELAAEAQQDGDGAWGNYGLWDQRAALDWVHANVRSFGGNPLNLTLSGRSAGAYSVHAQAAHEFFMAPSPSPGIFRRLVMYSNAIPANPKTIEEVQPQFDELVAACAISPSLSGPEKLAALRAMPAGELVGKVMGLTAHTFRPVLDGHFFPLDLFQRFVRGDFAAEFKARDLELLIGEVRDEETIYRQTNPPVDLKTLRDEVGNYYSPRITDALLDAYLVRRVHAQGAHPDPDPTIDEWKKIYGDIVADGQVRAPSRLLVRQLAAAGVPLSSVHRYMMAWRPSFMDSTPKELGVGHAYDKPLWNFSVMHGPTPDEEKVMRAWIKDLADFVHGRRTDYGTREWDEQKVLTPAGEIVVQKDGKWEYLKEVADELCAV